MTALPSSPDLRAAPRRIRPLLVLPVLVVIVTGPAPAQDPAGAGTLQTQSPSFSRDIRPVLSNACFLCHGPDSDSRQADLRLDRPDGLFDERDGRTVIRRGDPAASELIRRVLSDDPETQMPPPEAKKQLSDSQRQLLAEWIQGGATWEQHWAFVAPQKPVVPRDHSGAADNRTTEIDAFLLHKLRTSQLDFSAPAEPHVLMRRLFLDLIGLPPTIAEQEEWLPRLAPNAGSGEWQVEESQLAALTEYLLARPEYGERWARHWLDLARYADTNGYEKDRERTIWPYRDWVVGAINADMPFDQFTLEQLAGDLLPGATQSQKVATGFHRNTMLNEEGGIDPLEFRFHAMTDRVATTGTTWLGLTIGCAQCHTHKYDPITHREYYQFMALMNNCDEPSIELRPDDFEAQWQRNRETADQLLDELPAKWPADAKTTAREEFSQWLTEQRRTAVAWHNLHPVRVRANLALLQVQPDDTIFASGDTAKQDYYEVDLAAQDLPMTAIRLEVLPDERLPDRGPGTTYYEGTRGDFYLTEFTARSGETPVRFRQASHSYARNQYGKNPVSAQLTLDGDIQTGWSVYAAQGERNTAVYVLEQPLPPHTPLTIRMTFGRHFASALGLFRFAASVTESAPDAAPIARRIPDEVGQLLLTADDQLTDDERAQLWDAFLLTAPQLTEHADRIRKLRLPPETTTTLVLAERPPENPRPTFRHHRGEFLQPREAVEPGTPEFLHAWPADQQKNRLGLAQWIVDRRNPLTARVIVNRHWAAFFGRGLVATVDDFGVQGERPSHPELLDWLAVTLMDEDDWSIRRLHRRIVASRAYRQSAVVRPEATTVDPDNRFLSYAPRFRLDAEVIRDSALLGSGRLSEKAGGPPVRPLQPPGITEVAFGSPRWPVSAGEDRYRRSLYTLVKRTAPFAMTTTFDGLSGESCVAQRTRSNTPLQALTVLNDVMFLDLARAAGVLVSQQAELTDDAAKVDWMFRRLLARPPTTEELPVLVRFVEIQRERLTQTPSAAGDLMGQSLSAEQLADPAVTSPVCDQAAWTALVRSLFGLDEFLVRP